MRNINTVCSCNGAGCTLCMLSGEPLCESTIWSPCSCCATHLKWARCNTLVHVATLHDHFTTCEEIVACVVGHAKSSGVEYNVASTSFVQQRGACHCLFHINESLKHVVVNDDCFGCVFALFASFTDDDGKWFPNVSNLVHREKCASSSRVESRWHWLQFKICASEDCDDARHCCGIRSVNRKNATMRNTAACISHVYCVVQQRFVEKIVDVLAASGEELWVFFTKYPVTKNASAHQIPPGLWPLM